MICGDAGDAGFAERAARNADVVYQVLNPGYDRWVSDFPSLQAGVLAGAVAAGARLVSLDNVYLYGRPDGHPFTEDHPSTPCTRKGRVRARMAADLLAAHHAGHVEVTIGRASDYFGPGGGAQSPLGDRVMRPALAGGTARVLGDPDQLHTYTFLPDIAEGLAVLGEHPDAPGQVWHLPNDAHTRTTRQILDSAYLLAGHNHARVRAVPAAVLRLVGLVNRPAGELVEMLYEFQEPFIVDSTRITTRLGVRPTSLEEALTATLNSYR